MAVVCRLPGINAGILRLSSHRGELTSRGQVQGITKSSFRISLWRELSRFTDIIYRGKE